MSEIAEADILNKSNAFLDGENIQQPDIKHFKMLLHSINLVCKAFFIPLLSTIVPLSLQGLSECRKVESDAISNSIDYNQPVCSWRS